MNRTSERPGASAAFLTLLFFSGFASLAYEVLWTRQLLSTFGATVYASGTVLTSFMAGLALGSWLSGRFADRIRMHPLRIYAWIELAIGLYALLLPLLLQGITAIHVGAYREFGQSFYAFSLLRFALAFLILLLPALLMGATLPVVTRHGVPRLAEIGRKLGRLYAVNTIGAALGTFLTGYVLIEALGIRASTYLAVAINVLVFAGAMMLARKTESPAPAEEPAAALEGAPSAAKPEARQPKSPAAEKRKRARPEKKQRARKSAPVPAPIMEGETERWLVLLVIGISGCCALAYEVLWARILVYVLGNFVHSFSLMLTAFLAGIALGSYLLGRFVDRLARPARTLALFQIAIGLVAVLLLPIFGVILGLRDGFLESMAFQGSIEDYRDPWWTFTAWKLGVTFLLMFVPTLMMGASFPLANRLYIRRRDELARGVGATYASNTLGAILGSFSASFLLIPWLGLRDATLAMALVNLAGAGLLLARREGRWRSGRLAIAGAGITLVGVLGTLAVPANIFHPIFASVEKGKRLVYVDETVSGTVTIHETPGGFRVIDINGLNVAGTKFGFLCTQKLQAHFPLLMHPDPEAVMQIGFGTGGTCFSVSTHPEVERIDCVEINPGVLEAAPYFFENNRGILDDPKVTVTIEDARNYVLTTDRRYDVILSDSIHPRFAGNGLLYTEDYFQICAGALSEDGIFSTWLPTAFLGDEEFRMIVRSMQSVWPHVLVWYMNNTIEGYTITMASKEPFAIDWDRLAERMARPALAEDLAAVHVENAYDFVDFIILSGERVASYLDEGPLNTEDRPLIEFRAPRNMNRRITEFRNLERILEYRGFPNGIVASWGADSTLAAERRATLERYYQATGLILLSHQFHLFGNTRKEASLLMQANKINPDDQDSKYLANRLRALIEGKRVDW